MKGSSPDLGGFRKPAGLSRQLPQTSEVSENLRGLSRQLPQPSEVPKTWEGSQNENTKKRKI